jgi:hypothetical protein
MVLCEFVYQSALSIALIDAAYGDMPAPAVYDCAEGRPGRPSALRFQNAYDSVMRALRPGSL